MRTYLFAGVAGVALALTAGTPGAASAQYYYPYASPYVTPIGYTYPSYNYSYGYNYPGYSAYSYGWTNPYSTWAWSGYNTYPTYYGYGSYNNSPRYAPIIRNWRRR